MLKIKFTVSTLRTDMRNATNVKKMGVNMIKCEINSNNLKISFNFNLLNPINTANIKQDAMQYSKGCMYAASSSLLAKELYVAGVNDRVLLMY